MTTERRYGEDNPFGAWLRSQDELDSHQHAFTANDADWILLKYKTWLDTEGTREVQLSMFVEVKTNGAEPNRSQLEALFFYDQLLRQRRKLLLLNGGRVMVWSFGVFILSLQGTRPVDGDEMRWGMFDIDGKLSWCVSRRERSIVDLLGFRRDPRKPSKRLSLRRHHKTRKLLVEETTDIGLKVETEQTFRS